MVRRYNPLSFSALSLVPFFAQGCFPPLPDFAFIENASVTDASLDTGDTGSLEELTKDSFLTFSANLVTNTALCGEYDDFDCSLSVNVDGNIYDDPLFRHDEFSSYNGGYSALFLRDYPPNSFAEGMHSVVFQGILSPKTDSSETIYTPKVEVLFTLVDSDTEAPLISDLTATPQYAPNDSSILLEATVTDNKGIENVVATLAGSDYVLSDSDDDSVYSVFIDPSSFSLTPTDEYTPFSFTVMAIDSTGNTSTSNPALFYVSDAIPPEVADAGTSPISDNSPLTTWTVYATATDLGTGVKSVSVELNGSGVLLPLGYQGSNVYSLDLTGDNLSAPLTTYTLHAFDYAGLEATTMGTVSVENITGITINDLVIEPPIVSNASAADVTITLNAEDLQDAEPDLIASCTIDTLDITLAYQSGTIFTGTFDTSAFTFAQDYTVACTVEDIDGYIARRDAVLTLTDDLAPDVSCSATDGTNSTTTPSPLEVTCIVTEDTELTSLDPVTYFFSLGSGILTNTSGDIYEASISVADAAAGLHDLVVSGTDAAGNVGTYTVTARVTDAEAPNVSRFYTSASSVSNYGADSFIAYAEGVSDETAITNVYFTLNGTRYDMTDDDGDGTYESETITPSSWVADDYSLDLVISDGTNETTGSTIVGVTDGTKPETSSCSATTAGNDGSIDSTLTAVSQDETNSGSDLTIAYTITHSSGTVTGTLSYSTGTTYQSAVDLTGIPAGTLSATFISYDVAGNASDPCTTSFLLHDLTNPAILCTLASSAITNGSDSTTVDCVVSEETGVYSVTYSGFGSGGSLTDLGSGNYFTTLTASPTTAADSYIIPVVVTDTSGNTDSSSVTLTVTDVTAPTIDSVYTLVDGVSSSTVVDDGTQDFVVYVCATDETDGADLGGNVDVTIDSLTELLSYDSSSGCFVSRAIGGDELSAGTYTISATATDAAGNSTPDTSASLEVTCSGVNISNVIPSEPVVYNNNTPDTFTVSADITIGSCGGTVDTGSLEVTIDGITESMYLLSGSTYTSDPFTAWGMNLDTHPISITGADTLGNFVTYTSSTITISDICYNLTTDAPTATVGVYIAGSYAGGLTTDVSSWPELLLSVNVIQVGSYGTQFVDPLIINYNDVFAEAVYLTSACSGGASSGSTYFTSSYNDCPLSGTYDAKTGSLSIAFETDGSVAPTFAVNSADYSGTGTNYFKSGAICYINNGAGTSASLSACGSLTRPVTICINY